MMVEFVTFIIVIETILLITFSWLYMKMRREQTIESTLLSGSSDYTNYLNSEDWQRLRKEASARAGYKCELCGADYEAVHHIRYPSRYEDDHLDNLLAVCNTCHAKIHGKRDDEQVENNRNWYGEAEPREEKQIEERLKKEDSLLGPKNNQEESLFSSTEQLVSTQRYQDSHINENRMLLGKAIGNGGTFRFDINLGDDSKKQLMITEEREHKAHLSPHHYITIPENKLIFFRVQLRSVINHLKSLIALPENTTALYYSTQIPAHHQIFIIDVKIQDGQKHLIITQSKNMNQEYTESKHITIFEEEWSSFSSCFNKYINFVITYNP